MTDEIMELRDEIVAAEKSLRTMRGQLLVNLAWYLMGMVLGAGLTAAVFLSRGGA